MASAASIWRGSRRPSPSTRWLTTSKIAPRPQISLPTNIFLPRPGESCDGSCSKPAGYASVAGRTLHTSPCKGGCCSGMTGSVDIADVTLTYRGATGGVLALEGTTLTVGGGRGAPGGGASRGGASLLWWR